MSHSIGKRAGPPMSGTGHLAANGRFYKKDGKEMTGPNKKFF